MKYVYYVISFVAGVVLTIICFLFIEGIWDFKINLIDLLMLIATIVLSVFVLLLTKTLEKKDIVRDIIVKDLTELCKIYANNSNILNSLKKNKKIEVARANINMNFHKADLLIDCIKSEIKESFPNFSKTIGDGKLVSITDPYYKWLTGGDLMENSKFEVSSSFMKEHETYLNNTISSIKLLIHQLVKSI